MTEPLSIEALASGLARRGTPLPTESGLFIVLEAVEAMAARPLWLTPAGVRVGLDGAVSLAADLDTVSVLEAMTSALDTLEAVLMPPPSGALALAARVRAGEVETLPVFTSELEALLVPLNKGAARRMLGRLVREHARALDRPVTEVVTADDPGVGALLAAAEPSYSHTPSPSKVTRVDGTPGALALDDQPPRASERKSLRATDTEPDGDRDGAWQDDESQREDSRELARRTRGRSHGTGVAAVLLALVALVAAGVFLYHRLQRAESRASRRDGVDRGAAIAAVALVAER